VKQKQTRNIKVMASSASFSCYKSDESSCPTTPSSTGSQPNQELQDMREEFYALQDENQFLRSKLDSLAETLEYLQTRIEEQEEQKQQQQQSHKQWIAENLEEAQHFIDNIVGIKGITEAPLSAAVKMGISYAEPSDVERERELSHKQQQQLPRVSISSSIVPPHEELYGY
jgi:predicted nuclease with TOPRIM domain